MAGEKVTRIKYEEKIKKKLLQDERYPAIVELVNFSRIKTGTTWVARWHCQVKVVEYLNEEGLVKIGELSKPVSIFELIPFMPKLG